MPGMTPTVSETREQSPPPSGVHNEYQQTVTLRQPDKWLRPLPAGHTGRVTPQVKANQKTNGCIPPPAADRRGTHKSQTHSQAPNRVLLQTVPQMVWLPRSQCVKGLTEQTRSV